MSKLRQFINQVSSQQWINTERATWVLSVLSEVLEKVVHKQMYEFLETDNLLSPNQFGF